MAKIRLTESRLNGIISESIRSVLNEISPEMKARAMVKANHDLGQLGKSNDQVGRNLNGVPVHRDTQKRRRERQLQAFRNGLGDDMQKKFGRDAKFSVRNNPDGNSEFSVDYDGDRFRHFSNSDGGERGSVFFDRGHNPNVGHRNMRASEHLTDLVDGMAGYDSELKGHAPFNSRIDYLNDRANDVNNLNQYHKDKEEFERRKSDHDARMRDYDSLPWFKKPFKKRPLPFTDEEPRVPKIKTGHYFMPSEPEGLYKRGEEIKGNHDTNMNAYNRFLKKK